MFEKFLTETLKLAPRQMWGVEQQKIHLKKLFTAKNIKVAIASLLAIIELCGLTIFDLPTTPRGEELDLTGYSIVFEDEFEGNALNTDVWKYCNTGVRRGGYRTPSQVEVKDGNCVITAEYLKDGQFGEGWYAGDLALKKWYKQGYYEIRCKVSAGGGFWSAFWIMAAHPYEAEYSKGGIGGAEIDIFEAPYFGKTLSHNGVTQTIHCAGVDGATQGYQSRMLGAFYGNDIYNEYNTYGMKWTEDEYIFYINGVETARTSFGNGTSQVEEEVRVSLEVPDAEFLEPLDKETYHSEFVVDYVRIYQPTLTQAE